MLRIYVDNNTIDSQGASFTVKFVNNIDIDEGFPGSFVFNFSLPATQLNNSVFGYPARLSRFETSKLSYPARFSFNGMNFCFGTLKIVKASSRSIQVKILVDNGTFYNMIKDVMLPEIINDSFNMGDDIGAFVAEQVEKSFPEVDFNFPVIFNPGFYGPMEEPDDEDFVPVNPDYWSFMNLWNTQSETDKLVINSNQNHNVLVPQFFVFYVIKKIFTHFGYTVYGSLFSNQELMQLMFYNNFSLDKQGLAPTADARASATNSQLIPAGISFTVVDIDNDSAFPNTDPLDNFHLINNTFEIKSAVKHTFKISISYDYDPAEMSYGEVYGMFYLDGVAITSTLMRMQYENFIYTYTYVVAYSAGDIGKKLTYRVSNYKNHYDDFNVNSFVWEAILDDVSILNIFNPEIKYKNHMPNMKVSDFVSAVFLSFGIIPFFSEKTKEAELVLVRDILESAKQKTFSEKPIKDSIINEGNDYSGLSFSFDFGDKDEYLEDNFKSIDEFNYIGAFSDKSNFPELNLGDCAYEKNTNKYWVRTKLGYMETTQVYCDRYEEQIFDEGTKEISIPGAPILMHKPGIVNLADFGFEHNWLVPRINQKGQSTLFDLGRNEFDLRFFFWRGMQKTMLNNLYPMASTSNYDYRGNEIDGTSYAYQLHESEGLVNQFYSGYLNWLQTRQVVEFENQLTPAEIGQLSMQVIHRILEINKIFKEITIKIDQAKISPARIKGYTK